MGQRAIKSNELTIFYNAVGEAVWQIQYLEHAIVNLIIIKSEKAKRPSSTEEADELLDKERKGTLGLLYKKAKQAEIIPDQLLPRFDKFLTERNWLIHNSRLDNSEDLYNSEKTVQIIDRIKSIGKESLALTGEIVCLLEHFMISQGYNIDDIYKMAYDKLNNLQGA